MQAPEPRNLLLTTVGRRSGRPHTVELWFVRYDDKLYVATDICRIRDWCANLLKSPEAIVEVAGQRLHCRARLVDDAELKRELVRLRAQKYGSGWASLTSDIVELTVEGEEKADV